MTGWLPGFTDELQKIADEGSNLRRREALQFAGLGAAMGPAVGSLSNLIMSGRPTPPGVPVYRWLPASMLSGAIYGGVIPVLRHAIHRYNIRQQAGT